MASKCLRVLIIFAITVTVYESADFAVAQGAYKELSTDELKEKHVAGVAEFAIKEIEHKKLKNGELIDGCTKLGHTTLLSAARQIVSGVKYKMEIRVYPVAANAEDKKCWLKTSRFLAKVKPELCKVEVIWRPWINERAMKHYVCLKVED